MKLFFAQRCTKQFCNIIILTQNIFFVYFSFKLLFLCNLGVLFMWLYPKSVTYDGNHNHDGQDAAYEGSEVLKELIFLFYFLHSTFLSVFSRNALSVKAAHDPADSVRLQCCLCKLFQTGLSLHFKSGRIPQGHYDLLHTHSFQFLRTSCPCLVCQYANVHESDKPYMLYFLFTRSFSAAL